MHQAQASYEPIISHNGQSVERTYTAEIKNEFIKEKKVRFIIRYIFFTISLLIIGCKDQKPTKLSEEIEEVSRMNKFEWRPTECAPEHYPVTIYQGEFATEEDDYFEIPKGGVFSQGWGTTGSTWVVGPNFKSIPIKLRIIWISYTENQFYYGDFDLPKEKITDLFKRGYFNYKGKKVEYSKLTVGLAPGGAVSVWVMGAGNYVEVGHYQATKTNVAMKDFAPYAKISMNEFVQNRKNNFSEGTKNTLAVEGIPIGKWTAYRKSYNWKPTFKHKDGGVLVDFLNKFYNGDLYNVRADNPILQEFRVSPPTRRISFDWDDKTKTRYTGVINFDEKEIWNAFEKMYENPKNTQAELLLEVDKYNSSIRINLKSENDTIPIEKSKVKIYVTPV
ncbi:DUF2931 family protein [Cellulophaga sp. L1A9]|uniref:DUF2931 family protein n=1 Tax=Cellulophaga sp. L1A9 TaxID=2686362 RepID=UPI00131B7B04|nr:DUF2931 family protein [Cellulophaga sp. L1A9]